MNDVVINKVSGGLGRRTPSTDMVSALMCNAEAVVGGMQLGTVYKFQRIEDAIALGIEQGYDDALVIVVYEHIKEFFRINPNGVLWFMAVAKSVVFKDMVDPTNASGAKKLLIAAGGAVNQLAVAYNPTVPVTTDAPLLLAIAKAQLLVASEYSLHRPVHVILEGAGFDSASITDLHGLLSPGVSVMVGQNKAVATLSTDLARYGAVGTLLGAVSLAAVNENIAWIQKFNLLGDNLQDWSVKAVASTDVSESLQNDINDAGYISFRYHPNITGIYLNDSFTCDELTSDFAYIESNRTVNKATRLIRQAILPYLNSPITVDPTTGKIALAEIKAIEAKGRKAIDDGMTNELSGFTFTIDENQNILSTSELLTELSLIPTGTARNIIVSLGFSNPLNA